MADKNFFADEQQEQQTEGDQETPETIKIGEDEYSQEDLEKYVGLGKTAADLEKKWNTKMGSLMPEYTKSRQELKETKAKLEEMQAEMEKKAAEAGSTLTPEQRDAAKKQLAELIGGQPLTETQFRQQLDQWYTTRRQAERLLEECNEHEATIDGKDGRPKFETNSILQHMQETGIKSPIRAYKDKFENELDKWKEGQLKGARPQNSFTQPPTAGLRKEPKRKPIVGEDMLKAAVSEELFGPQE